MREGISPLFSNALLVHLIDFRLELSLFQRLVKMKNLNWNKIRKQRVKYFISGFMQ